MTHLGVSPRYLEELQRLNINPLDVADVSSLRMVNSTGAALLPDQFIWFYETAFHPHTQLANSAGGTDTACQFAVQNAFSQTYVGEIPRLGLGMKVEVYQQVDRDEGFKPIKGRAAAVGEAGELVITAPFPTMPVMFWGKDGAKRYREAYFNVFDGAYTGRKLGLDSLMKYLQAYGRKAISSRSIPTRAEWSSWGGLTAC